MRPLPASPRPLHPRTLPGKSLRPAPPGDSGKQPSPEVGLDKGFLQELSLRTYSSPTPRGGAGGWVAPGPGLGGRSGHPEPEAWRQPPHRPPLQTHPPPSPSRPPTCSQSRWGAGLRPNRASDLTGPLSWNLGGGGEARDSQGRASVLTLFQKGVPLQGALGGGGMQLGQPGSWLHTAGRGQANDRPHFLPWASQPVSQHGGPPGCLGVQKQGPRPRV